MMAVTLPSPIRQLLVYLIEKVSVIEMLMAL